MAMTISNHGRDSHLASQSVHFIWKSRLNENSQPPLPMLQLTKYLLLLPELICNSVTQIDRIGRVPNCDQTLRSICLISNIRHWFWHRHHSNETRFLEDVSFKLKGYKSQEKGFNGFLVPLISLFQLKANYGLHHSSMLENNGLPYGINWIHKYTATANSWGSILLAMHNRMLICLDIPLFLTCLPTAIVVPTSGQSLIKHMTLEKMSQSH